VSGPLDFAGTVSKVNSIPFVFFQEEFDPGGKWYDIVLEEIDMRLENLAGSRDRVSEDNDIIGIIGFHSII